jgi:ribosomal protein L7/L12
MSEAHSTSTTTIDRGEWSAVLTQLRGEGFSPVESIKVTRAVLHVSLAEAKTIVHESRAWADRRADFDQLHDTAEAATALL